MRRAILSLTLILALSGAHAAMTVPYWCTVHYGTNVPDRINDAWLQNVNSWPKDGLWLETEGAGLRRGMAWFDI